MHIKLFRLILVFPAMSMFGLIRSTDHPDKGKKYPSFYKEGIVVNGNSSEWENSLFSFNKPAQVNYALVNDSNAFYIRESLGEPGSWQTIFNPDTREVVATIFSYIVLLLGLAIIGIAIAQLVAKIRSGYVTPDSMMKIEVKKLAVTQIGLGLLATVGAFFVIIWGFPT